MITFITTESDVPSSPWSSVKIFSVEALFERGKSVESAHVGAYLTREEARACANGVLARFAALKDTRSLMPAVRPGWEEE